MTGPNLKHPKPRAIYFAVAIGVMIVGILSRKLPAGNLLWDKYLGDALYAIMIYLCLALLWPRQRILARTAISMILVACIECFQLTGIPLQLRQSGHPLLKLVSVVLGTHFGWLDMLAYAAGLAITAGIDLVAWGSWNADRSNTSTQSD